MTNRTREHFCPGEFCQVPTIQAHEMDYNEDDEFVYGWRCNNCGRWEAKRIVTLDNSPDRKPTPGQQRSIEGIRHHLEQHISHQAEKYGAEVTNWEVKSTGFNSSWWVSAQTELTGLGEDNLLRALEHEYWHFLVGPRGRVEAISYPKSYDQFKGQRVFGFINVK